ncbi:glycoprotein-N-acetylgalactosamine 3-beta-galactosyltransferase 1-like [Drosophila novamexicana]|uniref:glycoprotein-N-acetylgalactosamine 3-beta-galactosyltransferase 1-like n=1 Tax=Drosophila novamexicana TaxID=47314 RepID=UPI0011E5DE52|nr:glycoprotein-N-acetylgalactosamine 3-beta-galactosyltransferase 1-like [Drosophila novamexicana]
MFRNVLCLVLGLIVGMQLTELWDYVMLTGNEYESTAIAVDTAAPTPLAKATLADRLYHETRVLCLVLTMPTQHKTKAAKVLSTWGARCNKLIFLSSQDDVELGAVNLNVTESRDNLYTKVRAGLAYAYEHYVEDYDWFLKADDDTYVVMENLRLFLYPYDPEAAVFFGHRFRTTYPHGYMSGGAGYVLSRDALRRLNLFALNNTKFCPLNTNAEDRQIGHCLLNVGVVAGDSRDELARERFLPLHPRHLMPRIQSGTWLDKYDYFKPNLSDCCSDSGISFHYTKMYDYDMYEFFLYHLRIFGLPKTPSVLPQRLDYKQMEEKLEYWDQQISDNTAPIED